ncbi:T9SS type A sorting domain-containing protein [Flavobacterium stagni]|uniref:T9SS type A sorting domain-containing protein n=1 Tax=Flavobacterium stagni TaxID=2506421 RepID=A0A4Q1KFM7_9FLAO|nr:T9SS type A sorting domain-containing protein [Flavobacterium stagni]RXR24578.1 T9SS type A sorting domain-containing protein [Flavobacterium stagni]
MYKPVLLFIFTFFSITATSQIVPKNDYFTINLCDTFSQVIGNIFQDNGNGIDLFNGSIATGGPNRNVDVLTWFSGNPFFLDDYGNLFFTGDPMNSTNSYSLAYKLQEAGNPNNISNFAFITVTFMYPSPITQADNFNSYPIYSIVGGTTPSVLLNDLSSCGTNLTICNPVNFPAGFTLNTDGTITVAPGTAPGSYILNYTGCVNATICSNSTTVMITVSGASPLQAVFDHLGVVLPGSSSSYSILQNDLYANSLLYNTIPVTITPLSIPNGFSIDSNGYVNVAQSVSEGVYYVPYQICLNSDPSVCSANYSYVEVLHNRFVGKVIYDNENDGCDNFDFIINNYPINNVNGTTTYTTYTGLNWNLDPYSYYLIGDAGTNIISFDLPPYFTVTPPSQTFTISSQGTVIVPTFCVTANNTVNDVELYLIPLNQVVPGQAVKYAIYVRNWGTTTLSGQITLQYENSKLTYQSSTVPPNTTTANSLTFNYYYTQPFAFWYLGQVTFIVGIPPAVDLGTTATITGTVNPLSGDNTVANNIKSLTQIAVNSQDPNDIVVQEGPQITLAQAGDYLQYTIRFQNIGTSPAINVRVLNTLSPKLDWSTFQFVSSSFFCRVKNKNNQNEFLFERINLPGTNDEPNSHGYITYKVKPKTNVVIGDVITNDALIYFDYNAPIATNTVSTTIVNLGTLEEVFTQLQVSPNPTNGLLSLSNAFTIDRLSVRTLTGQLVLQKQIGANESTLDLSALENGIYLLTVQSEQQVKTIKIIKQ